MTVHSKRVVLAALLTAAFWPAAAWAQFGQEFSAMSGAGKPAISAGDSSTVQRKPTQLRLYMQLLAKGKTLEDALAKLKERQTAATAQLETLKADKKSIVFGSPSLSNVQSARKRQIEQMVIAQMRNRGKKAPKGLQVPQSTVVTATLTAQWPIAAESPEKMLLMVHGIQEKIKAADLAGAKEAEKLSPEEEEFEEEASQMASQFGGDDSQQPGQPQFVFVAQLSKPERQKALAEAVAKARQQAAELAKAAGVELGPMLGLTGGCTAQVSVGEDGPSRYSPYGEMMSRMFGRQSGDDSTEKPDESIGPDPGALKFTCYVTVLFQLGK